MGDVGFDLHVHTTASDGKLSPEEVVRQSVKINLCGLAITDHDTVDGIAPAVQFISQEGLDMELIPGIEFNTEVESAEVHILGYYLDYAQPSLLLKLQELNKSREERAFKMVERLKRLGLPIEFDRVKELAGGKVLGRPHVADAMIEKGYVFTIGEAFSRYLGYNQPAYVPRYKFLPKEAIDLIKNCGGLSVLAHPGLIKDQGLVSKFIAMGINGLEVYYPEHSEQQTSYYEAIADKNGLLVAGGSDFHGGPGDRGKLGSVRVKRELVQAMRNRLEGL